MFLIYCSEIFSHTSFGTLSINVLGHSEDGSDSEETMFIGTLEGAKGTTASFTSEFCHMHLNPFDSDTDNRTRGFPTKKATYTILVRLEDVGIGTSTMTNIVVTVFWLDGATITTNSGKFS